LELYESSYYSNKSYKIYFLCYYTVGAAIWDGRLLDQSLKGIHLIQFGKPLN
jgi:hypothetical protein